VSEGEVERADRLKGWDAVSNEPIEYFRFTAPRSVYLGIHDFFLLVVERFSLVLACYVSK
jgi:hypothetical protein